MKTILLIPITLLFFGIFSITCGAQAPNSGDAKTFSTVKIQTYCLSASDNLCPGGFGFTIDDQGNFIAGPDPKGKTVTGAIRAEELKLLTDLITQQMASREISSCRGAAPNFTIHIFVYSADGRERRLFFSRKPEGDPGSSIDECHNGTWQTASLVRNHVRKLLIKYYPIPFPQDE